MNHDVPSLQFRMDQPVENNSKVGVNVSSFLKLLPHSGPTTPRYIYVFYSSVRYQTRCGANYRNKFKTCGKERVRSGGGTN